MTTTTAAAAREEEEEEEEEKCVFFKSIKRTRLERWRELAIGRREYRKQEHFPAYYVKVPIFLIFP